MQYKNSREQQRARTHFVARSRAGRLELGKAHHIHIRLRRQNDELIASKILRLSNV